jgi:hypothetical protein
MLCIDYYEAFQRKSRANSWNDCHSRVEVSRQQAQKKICWDLGFRTPYTRSTRASRIGSLASGRGGPRYCGGQQSGLKKRLSSPSSNFKSQIQTPSAFAIYNYNHNHNNTEDRGWWYYQSYTSAGGGCGWWATGGAVCVCVCVCVCNHNHRAPATARQQQQQQQLRFGLSA